MCCWRKWESSGGKPQIIYTDDSLVSCEADKTQMLHLRIICQRLELSLDSNKNSIFPVNVHANIKEFAAILGSNVEKFLLHTVDFPKVLKKEMMLDLSRRVERNLKGNWYQGGKNISLLPQMPGT